MNKSYVKDEGIEGVKISEVAYKEAKQIYLSCENPYERIWEIAKLIQIIYNNSEKG